MKAIQLSRTGGPEVLQYVELPMPRVGPHDVLVKAHAIGVSMPELLVRRGSYPWMPPLPAIPRGLAIYRFMIPACSTVMRATRRLESSRL